MGFYWFWVCCKPQPHKTPAWRKAYIFYFTHPGRKTHFAATLERNGTYSYDSKRSSIQVAELVCKNGTLATLRDEPFDFFLPDLK